MELPWFTTAKKASVRLKDYGFGGVADGKLPVNETINQ